MGRTLTGNTVKNGRAMSTALTVVSGLGLAATAYLFARAGMKAERKVQHEVRVNEEYEDRYPSYKETALIIWPEFLIPTSVGIATLVCVVSTNILNVQNQATLMGAYALGERAWAKHRSKVAEMLGFENDQVIRTEVVRDLAKETKVPDHIYGDGDTVYYDVFSGQMFRSDEATILKAQENTNGRAEEEGFIRLNYFYDQIGARTSEIGEHMGWMDGHLLDVTLTPVTFEDGTEGFGIDYGRYPTWGYPEV